MLNQVVFRPNCAIADNTAIGTSSTQRTAAISKGTAAIRVMASINSWIAIGSNPTASVGAGSFFVPTRTVEYFLMHEGEKLAVICDDGVSTGTLNVMEMTR